MKQLVQGSWEKLRAWFGVVGVLLALWIPFSTVCSFFLLSIRDLVTRSNLPFLTGAAPHLSQVQGGQGWGSGCKSMPPIVYLCTESALNTAVAPGKLHQAPLRVSPPLYRVHDLYNSAIWTVRAAFHGYRVLGSELKVNC